MIRNAVPFVQTLRFMIVLAEFECPAIARTAGRKCEVINVNQNKYGGYADCAVNKRVYNLWYQMLRRCYDHEQQNRSRGMSYKNCIVCERWMRLSSFAADIKKLEGYKNWLNKHGYCLDKDIKSPGNNMYAPAFCHFVPCAENIREANKRTRSYRAANEANKVMYYLEKDGTTLVFESEIAACRYLGVKKCSVSSCRIKGYKCKGYAIKCAKMDLEDEQ